MCPLEYGLEIFGGKWKSRIICVLYSHNTLRYNQLKKELTTISDAVLAEMLKELINDGLVERIQYNEIPPRVEYNLSEKGLSVLPILASVIGQKQIRLKNLRKNFLPAKAVIS